MSTPVYTEEHNGTTVTLQSPTDKFVVDLASEPSTGSRWWLKNDFAERDPRSNRLPGAFQSTSTFVPEKMDTPTVGVPSRQHITCEPVKALRRGEVYTLEFLYVHVVSSRTPSKTYTLRVVCP